MLALLSMTKKGWQSPKDDPGGGGGAQEDRGGGAGENQDEGLDPVLERGNKLPMTMAAQGIRMTRKRIR